MSRHRNIHNMCEDDYYDYDDDYYDDDYWEEEDDDAYYQEQERLRKEQEAARKKAAAAKIATKTSQKKVVTTAAKKSVTISKPAATNTNTSRKDEIEKERLVKSMGFASQTARDALQKNGWDVQKAINQLLSSPSTMSMAPPAPSTMAPPPNFGKPKANDSNNSKGVMKPPPGMQPPSAIKNVSPTAGSVPKKSVGSEKGKQEAKKSGQKTTLIPSPSHEKSTMKKISPEMRKKLEAQKSRLSMVILGHVDAGKSTLMGQVLVQTGMVQKRTVAKYKKQADEIGKGSFALAWIMDEDESERERGVTIDIATKHIATNNHDLTILDAPGHADYVPAMITGAGVSDVGILVVSSTRGEFESGFDVASGSGGNKGHVGQTREHITLARGLGVSQLIIAVNKLDAAEPAWSRTRFEEIQGRLKPFLKQNGFDLKRVQFIPISGLTGVNIKESPTMNDESCTDLAKWYKGKTLLQAIDNFEPAKRNIDKPFRFIISDLYSEGKGIVVKGRVAQGVVSVGDKVAVLPVGDKATVSRIDHNIAASQTSDDFDAERVKVALAGDSVDLILTGIDVARISVGNILSDFAKGLRPKIKKKMQAKILVMEELTVPIIRGSQVLLHMHCLDVPAVVSNIISKVNRKDGSNIPRPRVLTGGSNATVDIKLNEKICLETYTECRSLGRFVLRRGGDTVAVGIIEQVESSHQ